MDDLIAHAESAVQRLECDDWEIGPFDGHCLRLTCKRCIFDRAVKELAAERAARQALREQLEIERIEHTELERQWSSQAQQLAALREALARHPQQERCAYALCTEAAIHPDPRQRPCVDGCKPLIYCTEHEAFYRALLAPPATEGVVVGFPCDLCGEQIEAHERWVCTEDAEGHQFRTHEGCAMDVAHTCSHCNAMWPAAEGGAEEDEYRQPCPNGCLGRWGEGTDDMGRSMPVPMYCNVHGCDVESPGMAYKPATTADQQQPEDAAP